MRKAANYTSEKSYDMLKLFDQFIRVSKTGKRLQVNGKRISDGTITNYQITRNHLFEFSVKHNFPLRLKSIQRLNKRSLQQEKKYYEKFYLGFTNYLYKDRGCFDNYVGANIKNIKTFFNYINKQMILITGDFYKLFHVHKEEIPIVALLPEELNYLIYHEGFEQTLSPRMKEVKDFFVFGCTVALRVSDLLKLTTANLRIAGEVWYLEVRAQKTATVTQIALPDYAIEIIKRYSKRRSKFLLPRFNHSNLNKYLKELAVLAGWTQPNQKTRMRQGRVVAVQANMQDKQQVRFADLITTHTMRRTAITVMLSLGMPEHLVRKISGHKPGSTEFFKYVAIAQAYQDVETKKAFDALRGKYQEM